MRQAATPWPTTPSSPNLRCRHCCDNGPTRGHPSNKPLLRCSSSSGDCDQPAYTLGGSPMTASAMAQQLAAASQLQRLRALRERKALQASQQVVRDREAQIRQLQARRLELQHSLIGPYAARMGVVASYASAAQEALDDQLERAEYALIDEEEELINARTRAASARTTWLQAVAQHQASSTLRDDARQSLRRERETTLEREDPPLRSAP